MKWIIPEEYLALVGSSCPSSCPNYLSTPGICKKDKQNHHHYQGVRTLIRINVDLTGRGKIVTRPVIKLKLYLSTFITEASEQDKDALKFCASKLSLCWSLPPGLWNVQYKGHTALIILIFMFSIYTKFRNHN